MMKQLIFSVFLTASTNAFAAGILHPDFFFNYEVKPFSEVNNSQSPDAMNASFLFESASLDKGLLGTAPDAYTLRILDEKTYHGAVIDPSGLLFNLMSGEITRISPPGLSAPLTPPTRGGDFFAFFNSIKRADKVLSDLNAPRDAQAYLASVEHELAQTPGITAVELAASDTSTYVAWGETATLNLRYIAAQDIDVLVDTRLANGNGGSLIITSQRLHLSASGLTMVHPSLNLPEAPANTSLNDKTLLELTVTAVPTGHDAGDKLAGAKLELTAVKRNSIEQLAISLVTPTFYIHSGGRVILQDLNLVAPRTLEVRIYSPAGEVIAGGRTDRDATALAAQPPRNQDYTDLSVTFSPLAKPGDGYRVVARILPQGGTWDEGFAERSVSCNLR